MCRHILRLQRFFWHGHRRRLRGWARWWSMHALVGGQTRLLFLFPLHKLGLNRHPVQRGDGRRILHPNQTRPLLRGDSLERLRDEGDRFPRDDLLFRHEDLKSHAGPVALVQVLIQSAALRTRCKPGYFLSHLHHVSFHRRGFVGES